MSEDMIPDYDRDAGNLVRNLQLAMGSRVMLTQNINTEDSLVNGAIGTISDIILTNNTITAVHVKFNDPHVGQISRGLTHDYVGIEIIQHEFFYQGQHIIRETFPLYLCYAATVHKLQCSSLDAAIICLSADIFEAAMAYVALSRVKTLEGVMLSAYNPTVVKAPHDALQEYHRLRHV